MGGIAVGQRADFIVLNRQSPALLGIPSDYLLDAQVFSSPSALAHAVFVAGKPVVEGASSQVAEQFADVMQRLWAGHCG